MALGSQIKTATKPPNKQKQWKGKKRTNSLLKTEKYKLLPGVRHYSEAVMRRRQMVISKLSQPEASSGHEYVLLAPRELALLNLLLSPLCHFGRNPQEVGYSQE